MALDYPTRPVRLVVGFPAGGSADIVARIVAQALTERMGQTFIVDNKPGAGSNLGTEAGRARRARRLHADGRQRFQRDQSDALQEAQLRPAQGPRPGRQHRRRAERHGHQSRHAGEDRSGVHRLRQGQSRQDQHGLGRHRLVAACGGRTVQDDDRRRHAAHALSRRRAGDRRSARRAHPGAVRHAARGDRQHPRRQNPRARGDLEEAIRRRCRTCRR